MKISYTWLLELTGLDWPVDEVAERLTLCGTACEEIEPTAKYFDKVVVGEVIDLQPVKGADKIRLATVNLGSETLALVCGAPNVAVGQKVPVATLGANMANGLKIKKAKIRGVESCGMICSQVELGISDDHSGIMVLEPDAVPGTPLVEALDFDDYSLGFELTPNRADSMSAIGLARDLAALGSVKLTYPEIKIREAKEKSSDHIKVSIEDREACGRFTARIIKNVKIGPSPWWMQKRLLTAGMRPINNIVDITNYVMLETGNPLHAFDIEEFGSNELVVRRAKDKEEFVTLDGDKHELTTLVPLITNGTAAMGTAGVMGGLHSGVSEKSHTILLEAAWFDPSVIRKSRRSLNMITESSQRFEKGVDPNNVVKASNRAAYLFQELCGGEVLRGIVDVYPEEFTPKTVTMRPARCCAIAGATYSVDRMKEILTGLEFEVSGDDPITAVVPTFRIDISREIDLIEEVVRIEGYDAIADTITNSGPLFTPTHHHDTFENELRTLLTSSGFDEMMGHGLALSKAAKTLQPDTPQLKIINPVSEDLDIMRNSLLLTALPVVAHNIAHRNLDLSLFEIGKVYAPPKDDEDWGEQDRLLMVATGDTAITWRDKPRARDFYDLSGVLENIGAHLHWDTISFAPVRRHYLIDDSSFAVLVGQVEVGEIGLLDPKVGRKFDIKQPVWVADLDVAAMSAAAGELSAFSPLPVYPAATRDLAMIVDESVRVGDVIGEINRAAGELAESVSLFDVYTGKPIPSGQKSIAIAISYRSPERSLSSEEVERVQGDVVAVLKKKFNVEIRDK